MKVPCKFNPGDKIFAKVKGFVYWPARVNPLPDDISIPPNKIPIFFYGTHEVFFIAPTSCWPYDEKNKSKWGKPRPRAYFNQGMDEIENYTTIYQFGIDPLAEEFLSQFYQFKKANGENSKPKSLIEKDQPKDDSDDEEEVKETPKKAAKKRNKSGSSASTKENKMTIVLSEEKKEKKVEIKEESIVPTKKRRISESALSSKENTDNGDKLVDDEEDMEDDMERKIDDTASVRKREKSESSVTEKKKSKVGRKSGQRKSKAMTAKEVKKEKIIDNSVESGEVATNEEDPMEETPDSILSIVLDTSVKVEAKNKRGLGDKYGDKDNDSVDSDEDDDAEVIPKTRCRSKSSTTKQSINNRSVASIIDRKSDIDDSESPSVDSDNPDDEDFRPAKKSSAKRNKSPQKPKPAPTPKRVPKPKKVVEKKPPKQKSTPKPKQPKATPKKKAPVQVDSDDSLSSISSVEDWQAKDEKQKKEFEEKLKIQQRKQLEMEETAVKEASRRTKAKRMSESLSVEVKEKEHAKEKEKESLHSGGQESVDNKSATDASDCKLEKEIMVNIYKTDFIEQEAELPIPVILTSEDDCDKHLDISTEKISKTTTKKKIIDLSDSCDEADQEPAIKIPELSPEPISPIKIPTETISPPIKTQAETTPVPEKKEKVEKIKKVKINLKELRVEKSAKKPKPPTTNRKRNRKISSSASSGSDLEIVNVKHNKDAKEPKLKRARLVEKSPQSDDNASVVTKTILEPTISAAEIKLQTLQSFNVDIRSSLVLGHEDYPVCLERFKALCEMDIDLVSLVKVWQLMDTVKKCRRYKRNERVKQEAQAVYKRFMEIYSRASKEEINTAQSLLVQYRHQNNVHNQNVGNESNKPNGGTAHGLTIPTSVADMFQNKLSGQFESHGPKPAAASASAVNNHREEPPKPVIITPTEDEINEEKMRLLSVDLEAKVSDILNKIEKNVDTNPINQRSLSHLLPSSGDGAVIKVPTQWKNVNENQVRKRHSTSLSATDKLADDELSDVDEDDVEAIVRRIEEVAIRLTEPPVENTSNSSNNNININNNNNSMAAHSNGSSNSITGGGSSSLLDARIENLINNSFISTKESSSSSSRPQQQQQPKKPRQPSRHHKSAKPATSSNSPPRPVKVEPPTTEAAATPAPHHHHQQSQQLQNNSEIAESAAAAAAVVSSQQAAVTAVTPSATVSVPSSGEEAQPEEEQFGGEMKLEEEQKDDIEIYDLLGV